MTAHRSEHRQPRRKNGEEGSQEGRGEDDRQEGHQEGREEAVRRSRLGRFVATPQRVPRCGARQLDMRRLPASTGGRRPSPAATNGCPLPRFTGRDAGDSVASARRMPASGRPVDHLEGGDTPWPRRQQRRPPPSRQPRPRRNPRRNASVGVRPVTLRGAVLPRPFCVYPEFQDFRISHLQQCSKVGGAMKFCNSAILKLHCGSVTPSHTRIRVIVSPTSSRSTTSMPFTTWPNTV